MCFVSIVFAVTTCVTVQGVGQGLGEDEHLGGGPAKGEAGPRGLTACLRTACNAAL